MSPDPRSGPGVDVVEFDGRPGWSRRTRILVVVVALVLGGGWAVVDRARSHDERRLGDCRTGAGAALRATDARLSLIADYLQPALLTGPVEGRGSLYVLMSRTAAEYAPRLERALGVCRDATPAWFHPDLATRQQALVDHLSATLDRVQGIADDGRRYYRDTPELAAQRDQIFGGT